MPDAPAPSPLFDAAGTPVAARIELVEASGPVSPKHHYTTTIVVEAAPGVSPRIVRDHRDASGEHHDERALDRAAYEKIFADVLASLPLGESRDLVASKRNRKGISFNHVAIVVGDASARLDYLLSQVDEDET
ncbi:hypothetical protein G6O46_24850, partial [Salmonella enterica subsp. enterica serovar Enteritidis]|uniref:hypothetical protein n=1 Tax=Salmonella enterica TaxID=28901 RepID=UPI0016548615